MIEAFALLDKGPTKDELKEFCQNLKEDYAAQLEDQIKLDFDEIKKVFALDNDFYDTPAVESVIEDLNKITEKRAKEFEDRLNALAGLLQPSWLGKLKPAELAESYEAQKDNYATLCAIKNVKQIPKVDELRKMFVLNGKNDVQGLETIFAPLDALKTKEYKKV
eukprot:UN24541